MKFIPNKRIKRQREKSSVYEETNIFCLDPTPLRYKTSKETLINYMREETEEEIIKKEVSLLDTRSFTSRYNTEISQTLPNASLWSNYCCSCSPTTNSLSSDVSSMISKHNLNLSRNNNSNFCLNTNNTSLSCNTEKKIDLLSLVGRVVEVNVTRGDTGKSYYFTFTVPPIISNSNSSSSLSFYNRKETINLNIEYRNIIVGALLNQIEIETTLLEKQGWVFIFNGKNVQSEAGAESLISALVSNSCQRLYLAVFHNLKWR